MKKIIIGLICLLLLTGCSSKNYAESEVNTIKVNYTVLIDKKLYYIPHKSNELDFPMKYEKFLQENPKLEIIDVEAVLNEDAYNSASGYFIFTK